MDPTPQWLRPKTTKAYLHMPLSERICILCPDFKILNLSLLDNDVHVGQNGIGMILLQGTDMQAFDLDKTAWREIEGGIPIYEVQNRTACKVSLESFCTDGRNPTVCFKITVKNDTNRTVSESIGIMPRSGQEKYMLNQHQEGYSPYRPNLKNWYMLKRTWRQTSAYTAEDSMGGLRIDPNDRISLEWVETPLHGHRFAASDYFRIDYTLAPEEQTCITGTFRAHEISKPLDYAACRAKSTEFWRAQLERIKIRPDSDDPFIGTVFAHMATQCTQMLARYEGSDLIATRQGDIGRFVWPYEGVQVLTMLDRIGLCEHTAQAYRYYCERWLVKEGADRGKIGSHAGWENFTGSVIYGISEHLKRTTDTADAEYFIPHLLSMRDWIERKRQEPREHGYKGIFPVGKGSDWGELAQFWTFTDCHNVMALRSMCDMLEQYGHDEASSTRAICEDYRNTLIKIRDSLYRGHEGDETFIFPHELGVPFEDSETYSYYTDGAPYMLYTGFIEPESRMREQMESFFRNRGQFENGLTGRMTSCSSLWDEAYFGGYGDVWYTMQSEIYWIRAWLASGEKEKAQKTLDGLLRYGMTEELIVAERYCSINPWYSPWQPNGSGSARMIEILLSFYGEKQK